MPHISEPNTSYFGFSFLLLLSYATYSQTSRRTTTIIVVRISRYRGFFFFSEMPVVILKVKIWNTLRAKSDNLKTRFWESQKFPTREIIVSDHQNYLNHATPIFGLPFQTTKLTSSPDCNMIKWEMKNPIWRVLICRHMDHSGENEER